MTTEERLNFHGPAQPYRLRGGEYGVVISQDSRGNWTGKLLPSEFPASWDRLGRDVDGHSQYDLMELVRPNTPDSHRFSKTVERILAMAEKGDKL